MSKELLTSATTNARGAELDADGGNKTFAVWGTFGGATVTLQASPDNGVTWITLTIGGSPAAFTANAVRLTDRLGQGMMISCIISGATGTTDIDARIYD